MTPENKKAMLIGGGILLIGGLITGIVLWSKRKGSTGGGAGSGSGSGSGSSGSGGVCGSKSKRYLDMNGDFGLPVYSDVDIRTGSYTSTPNGMNFLSGPLIKAGKLIGYGSRIEGIAAKDNLMLPASMRTWIVYPHLIDGVPGGNFFGIIPDKLYTCW